MIRRTPPIDIALTVCGIALAGGSVLFAVDAGTTPQRYGAPSMAFERLDDPSTDLANLSIPPTIYPSLRRDAAAGFEAGLDPTTTASITPPKQQALSATLLYRAGQRALLDIGGRIIIVAPGTRLPDGDRVQTISASGITTRGGQRFTGKPRASGRR